MEQYEFGPFRLEAATRALYRGGEFIPVTPKAAEILLLLLREAGRVVTKELLLEQVWPGVVVEEGAIANNVSALRKVLDPEFGGEGPIATVPRRGYRFTAEVRRAENDGTSTANDAPTATPPVITERDSILVADIENRTGDPVFEGTLRQALLLHFAQSPFLEVLTDRKVLAVLGYMGKAGAPVLGEVALEVCQRTNSKAAITGFVFAIGDDYVIGLQALKGESGDILVAEQARAHGKGEVLKALDAAAIGLRAKLGESLASVRQFSRPFDEVATASLEALRAYTVARVHWLTHGEAAGKPHYLRAVELDPEFSAAYSALSLVCSNMGQTQEAIRYMQRAYDLRDRATDRERARLEASYHATVTGDAFKGIDAHRVWETSYPRDGTASANAGNLYAQVGQWDKALAANQRGHAMEATAPSASNLALALLALERHEEARAVLDDSFARGLDAFYLHLDAYLEAFLRADAQSMKRHADSAAGRASEEDFLIAAQADTEAYFGRYERARELTARAVESARDAGSPEMAAMWQALAALREVEAGDAGLALAGANAALAIGRGRDVDCLVALVLARSGDPGQALALAQGLEQDFAQHTIVQRLWLPCIRAAVAIGAGEWKAAVSALEPAESIELGITLPFENGLMLAPWLRGHAHLGAGSVESAVAEFRKIVEHPGLIKNFLLLPLARARLDSLRTA